MGIVEAISNFFLMLGAAILVGKVVSFSFILVPTLDHIFVDPAVRMKITNALVPKYYYLGMGAGFIIGMAALQLGHMVSLVLGILVILAEGVGRLYFLPKMNKLKTHLDQLPEDERKKSSKHGEWRQWQRLSLKFNIGILVAGLIVIGTLGTISAR